MYVCMYVSARKDNCDRKRKNVAATNVLVLSDPLARPVEAVAADDADGEEVVGWAEAARGDVALFFFFVLKMWVS